MITKDELHQIRRGLIFATSATHMRANMWIVSDTELRGMAGLPDDKLRDAVEGFEQSMKAIAARNDGK